MKNYTDEINELREAIAKLEQEQETLSLLGHCHSVDGHSWSIMDIQGSFIHLSDVTLQCTLCKIVIPVIIDCELYIKVDDKKHPLDLLSIPDPKPIVPPTPFNVNEPYGGKGSYKVDTTHLLADAQARGEI